MSRCGGLSNLHLDPTAPFVLISRKRWNNIFQDYHARGSTNVQIQLNGNCAWCLSVELRMTSPYLRNVESRVSSAHLTRTRSRFLMCRGVQGLYLSRRPAGSQPSLRLFCYSSSKARSLATRQYLGIETEQISVNDTNAGRVYTGETKIGVEGATTAHGRLHLQRPRATSWECNGVCAVSQPASKVALNRWSGYLV